MTSHIRRLAHALAAVVIAALPSVSPAAAEPFRLIITDLTPPLVPNSVMDLADRLGYFAAEGVEVEFVRVQQTPSAVVALGAGEGEMANISLDAALQLVARGQLDLVAVTSPNKSLPFLIAAKEEIATLDDLEGRSFGVGRLGSLDHSLSTAVLRSGNVDTDKIDIVGLGQPQTRAQALAAGQIDATTMSIGVWLSLPDKTGLHVLVPPEAYFEAAPVVNKVNVVTREVLATRRREVIAVTRALIRASRDFAENPEIWVDAMAEARPDVDRETLTLLGNQFRSAWSVNGGLNERELQFSADWSYQNEDFAGLPRIAIADWVDFSVAAAILEEIGTVPGIDPPSF